MESPCHKGAEMAEVAEDLKKCRSCGQDIPPKAAHFACVFPGCGRIFDMDGNEIVKKQPRHAPSK